MLPTELDSWEGVDHAPMARGGAWEPLACLRFVAAQAPIYGDMDLNDGAASIHHHGSRNPFCAQAMDSCQRVVSIGAPLNQLNCQNLEMTFRQLSPLLFGIEV